MKLIVVKEFDDYISAYVVMGRLKEEDIICHLQDEHTITTAPFLSPIFGGIKLMVPEAQAQRAKDLLTKWQNEQAS
ncbi:MAG TPA: DUF2007 domain-containing protein [Chitinophagaceae bacterium]|nr:DUF2007 domain-containing protein [Chitinophagaceae bacterium]